MILLCGLDIARVHLIIAVCDVAFSTGLPPGKLKGYNKYRMLGSWSRLRCHFPPKKKTGSFTEVINLRFPIVESFRSHKYISKLGRPRLKIDSRLCKLYGTL